MAESRRRGRPPLEPGKAKRAAFNTRLRSALKAELETAAERAGRSLSEEIEFRLERSLEEQKRSGDILREGIAIGGYLALALLIEKQGEEVAERGLPTSPQMIAAHEPLWDALDLARQERRAIEDLMVPFAKLTTAHGYLGALLEVAADQRERKRELGALIEAATDKLERKGKLSALLDKLERKGE